MNTTPDGTYYSVPYDATPVVRATDERGHTRYAIIGRLETYGHTYKRTNVKGFEVMKRTIQVVPLANVVTPISKWPLGVRAKTQIEFQLENYGQIAPYAVMDSFHSVFTVTLYPDYEYVEVMKNQGWTDLLLSVPDRRAS